MDTCTIKQGCQMKPKLSVRKENISDAFLMSLKSLLESKKELCKITEGLRGVKKENLMELTFLGISEESETLRDVEALHLDLPELIRSLHLCSLNDCEVILLKDSKEGTTQGCFSGTLCVMSSPNFPYLKSDFLFNLMSKYTTGIKYTMDHQLSSDPLRKASHGEEDDTNQSVSSIEDDFVTAFEHLDEEDLATNVNQERGHEIIKSQRDASSQTQPAHCVDIRGSKIMFSSLRRRSSLKSATLMGLMGFPDLSASVKSTVTSSVCDSWKQMSFSVQDKPVFTPPSAESSESECSSPSPIIFLDEEGYQKSLKAKLNLPKIPVVKDDIEDSDSELSEFFDSFDQLDETESSLLSHEKPAQKNALASPPKKRKCVAMNPQKFKSDHIILSVNVKKPTPRKPESPYSNIGEVKDSPHPVKATVEDSTTLFSPISSSAFSPLGISTPADTLECNGHGSEKDRGYSAYTNYANCVCSQMFDSLLNTKPPFNNEFSKKGVEKSTKLKRKSYNKESERKLRSKQKNGKGGMHKFASELVEKSLGSAFKDLQRGVSSCTSALCQLAARLTSYVFQMAFYEIRRMQEFSIKKRAINSLANLMASEVITSALQELRCIKKQMVTNVVTRFAADLAEELVFEGIMEVCQFSHPPTPVAAPGQTFDYDDAIVSSYAKDLSESVIQEAFIELSQVNVTFTTQAAISVSMDNLKYVNSESMMQSTHTSVTFPHLPSRIQSPLATEHDMESDYTVQHALLFTSGLISSVPVPVAAKALTFYKVSNETLGKEDCVDVSIHHDMNSNTVDCYSRSTKCKHAMPSTRTILPISGQSISNCQQEKQHLQFKKLNEDNEDVKAFSVSMVDMLVNEAYDVISSSKETNYAEVLAKNVVLSQQILLDKEQSQLNFADGLAKCILQHSIGESSCPIPDRCIPPRLKSDFVDFAADKNRHAVDDSEICANLQQNAEQQLLFMKYSLPQNAVSQNTRFTTKPSQDYRGAFSKGICVGNSDVSFNKLNSESITSKRNVQSRDTSYSSIFGLQTCLSHINNFSSVMCSCGDDLSEEKTSQRESSMTTLPDAPPPTPLASFELSPERSIKKLSKKLKGQLAKEFYPATPPSTPHLITSEHDSIKKDDFLFKVMRSLSEEVETSSSDGSSEDFSEDIEVSEETSQYTDYLSTNIVSVAAEMAADVLDDKSVHRSSAKNKSLLGALSDKWGYPAYMRNVSEESLETLCKYAGVIAEEVLSDAKKVVGKKPNTKLKSICYVDCCHCRKHPRDCRPNEKGCICTSMNFKESDPSTLSIAAGLTSKYPSCESVTEEYADHIIRVLKMEGGNNELIIDQYASRLVYRAVKSGLQQASKTIKIKCNRKPAPRRNSEANSMQELLRLLSMTQHQEREKQRRKSISNHSFGEESSGHGKDSRRPEFTGLLRFADTLAHTITCDVRRNLKISSVSLPKSLTDSCLYTKSKTDEATGDLAGQNVSQSLLPYSQTNKLYHSTGSLNDEGLKVGVLQAIEQYACKVVDRTIEFTLEASRLKALENRKNNDKVSHTGKPLHSYGPVCRVCSAKEQGHTQSSCHFLLGPDVSRRMKQCSRSKHNNGHKSRLFNHNIPKIHIDFDKRAIFAEKVVSVAIEKAERELSNTSLAADSGIGQDGISFADSLTTEIMMCAMKNIGHVNQSCDGKDGFQSAESVASQQTSVSVGDDSTGSWSNLSFEDEHQDESSSFLHLSDSNGNSSSWSSLGLEGDLYEENLSFPPSDSDGAEDRDENREATAGAPGQLCKTLFIRNVDMGPYVIESQLRTTLQWIVASDAGVSELYFVEGDKKELLAVSRRLVEKAWSVGDLLQAVVHYCEITEKLPSFHKPLFGWLLDHS